MQELPDIIGDIFDLNIRQQTNQTQYSNISSQISCLNESFSSDEEGGDSCLHVPISPSPKFLADIQCKKVQSRSKLKKRLKSTVVYKWEDNRRISCEIKSHKNVEYKQIQENGQVIKGFWKNGVLDGEARIKYENGEEFIGKIVKGVRTQGKYHFLNGDVYRGQFSGKYLHGKGTLNLKKERIKIVGKWNKNQIEGIVRIIYGNGDIYFGHFKNMKKDGKGAYFFEDGKKFVGYFEGGKIEGKGILYDSNGEIISKGVWSNGNLISQNSEY